jgi:hypothetical protein
MGRRSWQWVVIESSAEEVVYVSTISFGGVDKSSLVYSNIVFSSGVNDDVDRSGIGERNGKKTRQRYRHFLELSHTYYGVNQICGLVQVLHLQEQLFM